MARESSVSFAYSLNVWKVCHRGLTTGPAASSCGLLLKTLGLKVTAIKIDPYMNIDAGTMAPTEHGQLSFQPSVA